jgi:hypothetical protein
MIVRSSGALRYECFAGVEQLSRLGKKCEVRQGEMPGYLSVEGCDWCDRARGGFFFLMQVTKRLGQAQVYLKQPRDQFILAPRFLLPGGQVRTYGFDKGM